MKNNNNNRQVYKFMFMPVGYFLISCSISTVIMYTAYVVLDILYRLYRYEFVNFLVDGIKYLKYFVFGEIFYYILCILFASIIYYFLTYKKFKAIASLVDKVEIMAQGNLNQEIDVDTTGDINRLAENINNIVSQLRSITTEERRAQQTKNDLITSVSHDLRTPLTSIIGYLGLIEDDKYRDEVEMRYYTNIAYEKAQNLNVLINDLFELTKMQNNTLKLNKVEINLAELIRQVIYSFEYELKAVDMESRLRFTDDELIINADPIKIVRVFENLITNAMRYGKEGHYIDIVTKKEGDFAIVQVINYGEPIPVVELPHIFDRFYRVEKSRNRCEGGSGLGLAITKNIIELHGGSISVKSDTEKTIFEIVTNVYK